MELRELAPEGVDVAGLEARWEEIVEGDLLVEDDPGAILAVEEDLSVVAEEDGREEIREAGGLEQRDEGRDPLVVLLEVHEGAVRAHLRDALLSVFERESEDGVGGDHRAHLFDGGDPPGITGRFVRAFDELEDGNVHAAGS